MSYALRFALLVVLFAIVRGATAAEPIQRSEPVLSAERLFAPDHLVKIEIEMNEADWDKIRSQSRMLANSLTKKIAESPFSYVQGNVTIDGVRIDDVGIRKKGFFGSLSTGRPSLKIKFSEYKSQSPVAGLDRLTLNNNKQDPSRLSQYLSCKIFNESGTVAPRCNFAKVTVNGKYLGIYSNVESIKPPFLKRFGDDSGALYEGTVADFFPDLTAKFEPKNNRARAHTAHIERMVTLLHEEVLDLDAIEQLLDIDAFIRYWAIESLIGLWDGYTNNQNNFFVYRNPRNDKLYFIPWGPDSAFVKAMPLPPYVIAHKSVHTQSVLANRLYADPRTRQRYHATLRELLADDWDEDRLLAEVDRVQEMLKDHIHEDNRVFSWSVDQLRRFIRTRRSDLNKDIAKWPIKLADGPRKPSYFSQIGTANVTFETQWYDRTPSSPEGLGQVKMEMVLEGEPIIFKKIGAFAEPNKQSYAREEDGRRPPTIVFYGHPESGTKQLTLGVGLSSVDFQPTGDRHVNVQGILIEGSPVMFFVKLMLGANQLVWVNGQTRLDAAEMELGAPVQGEMALQVFEMRGGKPE
jgi:spore coat protein CotH